MSEIRFPQGFVIEPLDHVHPRGCFHCGREEVDDWLASKALQSQKKSLSTTKLLLGPGKEIAGYYTLAMGQVDFNDLPVEIAVKLPRRLLPVAVLAWLGIDQNFQGRGLGRLLLAQSLRDCHVAGQFFAFVAVMVNCLDDRSKAFYQQWDFQQLPGHPYRLFLGAKQLDAMMR